MKIFKDGEVPQGASRDWHITSKLKHPLIVDTFTIETFHSTSLNKDCIAVISRFIEGKNLEQILDKIDSCPPDKREIQSTYLLKAISRDLCASIRVCHEFKEGVVQGFGHGDLHERNIIVRKVQDKNQRPGLEMVLIDFDNATCRKMVNGNNSEIKRMESDIRAIRNIVGCITFGYRWHDSLQTVLSTCQSAEHIRIVLSNILSFLGHINNVSKADFNSGKFLSGLRALVAAKIGGLSCAEEYRNFLETLAGDLNVKGEFDKAMGILLWNIKNNPNYPVVSVGIDITKAEEINAIEEMF